MGSFESGDSTASVEGTAVLSTGESGGSKFLREDGDGTCSWQTVSTSGGISWDGSTANGVATFKDSDEATVEANLTFDGTDLKVASTGKLAVGDTDTYIHQASDSNLAVVADGDITLDAGDDIVLDADGDVVSIKFGGAAGQLDFTNANSGDVVVQSKTDAKDLVFKQYDGTETLRLTDAASVEVKDNLTLKSDSAVLAFGADGDVTLTHAADTSLTCNLMVAATTFEPSGDTAAGDNAAIGYTSAEGLILTGQGSTNDVTIKNDADQDVIEIPTGTTNVTIAGALTTGGILKTDDATEATSTTDGSLQTDGGLSVAKSAVIGDDLDLLSNSAILNIGSDQKFTATHANANNTLTVTADHRLAFGDAGDYIAGDGTDISIVGSNEINLDATTIDVNGKVTLDSAGTDTTTAAITQTFTATGASTVKLLDLNFDKTGASTTNNEIYGIFLDMDNTTATNGTNEMYGLKVTPTLTHAADAGIAVVTGASLVATSHTNGNSIATGLDVQVTGADTNTGVYVNCADGGTDLKLVSSADTGDYFSISTTTHGATTIATVDDDGSDDADLTLDADGKIAIEAKDGDEVVFNEGDNDVDFRVETVDETHMIFVEGSTNRVSIGDSTDSPAATLEITNHASAGSYGVPLVQLNSNDTDKIALEINAANIDANVLDITADALTTAVAVEITTDARTTGTALNISDSATNDSAGSLVKIAQTGSRAGSAASIGLDIDFNTAANANARALRIDSEQTTGIVAELDGNAVTTGNVMTVSANALTSGDAVSVASNSSDNTARSLLKLTNDHASATGTSVIEIDQDSTGALLKADYGANGSSLALQVKEFTSAYGDDGSALVQTMTDVIPQGAVLFAIGIRCTVSLNNNTALSKIGFAANGGSSDDDHWMTAGTLPTSGDGAVYEAGDTLLLPVSSGAYNTPFYTDTDLTFTFAFDSGSTNPTAGTFRVALYYYSITPPTS